RRRRRERELALPRRQESRADRRRRSDLVQTAEALSEALLPHAARERLHPRERHLSRLLPLAAPRSPRVRALVGDDRVGPAFPALRADGPRGRPAAGPAALSRRPGFFSYSLIDRRTIQCPSSPLTRARESTLERSACGCCERGWGPASG